MVSARYAPRTALIQSFGTMFNGADEAEGGSGILVGESLILTNSHVILRESNYKQWHVEVRLLSRTVSPLQVGKITRDDATDLALIELAAPITNAAGPTRCPMPVVNDADQAPMGTELYVLGFPLDRDLSLTSGLISNHSGDHGTWQTDSVMNAGNSGGPVFNQYGALVGLAEGGIVSWAKSGVAAPVTGVNFIIPATVIAASPLFSAIKDLPQPSNCWTSWSNTSVNPANFNKISAAIVNMATAGKKIPEIVLSDILTLGEKSHVQNVPISQIQLPSTINRDFTVSETKDNHPVVFSSHSATYTKAFAAEPGYRITACNWQAETANHAGDLNCNVQAGQQSAIFSFRLTSGPQVDQWRGWWGGTVSLAEEKLN
jgi:hypothetical protein